MTNELSRKEDMWTPFKELQTFIESVTSRPVKGVITELDDLLRKHKQNFIALLKNPPKNAKNREELRKAITDGINLPGIGHQILPKELVDESIIISDMFDLNEFMALDFLCTAQQQMPNHPGLTRGLVAVLLYYDGRKALVTSLRTLVQARRGISWISECSEEITDCITKYTDQLMEDGLINKVLDLLDTLDLCKEIELLQQNRALGNLSHHHQVVALFQDIKQTLADIVYFWAAQSRLPRQSTVRLIQKLKTCKLEEDASGGIDGVIFTLEMALLCSLDISILQSREDSEDIVQKLPFFTDSVFPTEMMKELTPSEKPWENSGLQALSQLALGLALATLRMAPTNLHTSEFIDEDDVLVDSAIELKVFEFLHRQFLENETIYKEEFYLRRLHTLLTDFIVLMPLKVKDLRNRADETARTMQVYAQEGIEPPVTLSHHFEHLLLSVERLYHKDPLKLNLTLDYWCPPEKGIISNSSYLYRMPPRQVSLYKFVHLAGELLPSLLFVPYLKMLSRLASSPPAARHAFNMLKQNGAGTGASLSWDHFFKSLKTYYSNLRQDQPPTTDTVYRPRSYARGISSQEVQGLMAVLAVIRTVAEYDEVSRVALCENPNWVPLFVLLGLVSCSVPIPLKAELLLTLAALARSPDTAATLWHSLEASQILSTVPSTSSYQPRGVQTELEEIESRNEEFPLTRALLTLLDILTNVPVPRLLGVGSRTPGFDPYLNFVINSVFLRFNTRLYKNPSEKWDVALRCLQLMVKLVGQYNPQSEDFAGGKIEVQGGGAAQVNPPPGYHLMVNLNSKSEFLRLVLFLLDEGCQLLDTYQPFPGKAMLELSMLSCLELLDRALGLQHRFLNLISSSDSRLLLTGLNKLLMGVNPRSGKPDHLVNITKYVMYNSWMPRQALVAVRILLVVTSYSACHGHLIGLLTATPFLTLNIRHSFVQCLEAEQDDSLDHDEEDGLGVQGKTKEAILKLLQQCLHHPAPNTAHYLFGFDINRDIKKTIFQQPGMLGFPRTCLHSLLAILDLSLQARTLSYIVPPKPRILDLAFSLLYSLCANTKTSEPVLRFLRSSNDFLLRHLKGLPFTCQSYASGLTQMSWLLKTVAIEIKVTASNKQQSQLTNLVTVLLKETNEDLQQDVLHTAEHNIFNTEGLVSFHITQLATPANSSIMVGKGKKQKLLHLLEYLNFSVDTITAPTWEFFEPSQIEQVMSMCEMGVSSNLKVIDIRKLHHILIDELAAVQGNSSAGQRQLILQEIQSVLAFALKHNRQRSRITAMVRYMDAWRQVTEVLFAVVPPEVLTLELRKPLLLEATNLVLDKVVKAPVVPEMANLASGVVLLLLVNLRHCLILSSGDPEASTIENLPNTGYVKLILANVLEWILSSGVGSQKLRSNMYGSLLNLLHISCKRSECLSECNDVDSIYISRLDSSMYRSKTVQVVSHQQANLQVLIGLGEGLVDVFCHDCLGGHDICKMLALSCLDMLIELDPQTSWMTFMSTRGYLKHLIDSLLDADGQLATMLQHLPSTLRPLYVYESKMALLCRIASSHAGAEMLLEQGTLACLSSMAVFDKRPQIRLNNQLETDMDFIPSISARYMQILFPALDFCDAILTALGTNNQSCTVQIVYFLLSHNETVNTILQSGNPFISLVYLKELVRLTGVIARSSNQDLCRVSSDQEEEQQLQDITYKVRHIRQLMLGLLSRFVVSESVMRELAGQTNPVEPYRTLSTGTGEAVLCFLQVACHLVLFSRNIIASRSSNHRASSVIFEPVLSTTDRRLKDDSSAGPGYPNLGVVVHQLMQCVEHHHRAHSNLELLTRKLKSVPHMNSNELKEFMPENASVHGVITEMRILATRHLEMRVGNKGKELEYYSYLIENSLYLIWSHLDYYMLRAIPRSKFGVASATMPFMEMSWNVTTEEIKMLKNGLVPFFNDSFNKKLLDTTQGKKAAVSTGFVEVLLRRIKRLIQFVPV